MWVRDVNNYGALTEGGKIKLKGAYVEDYSDNYHKNPSQLAVPMAVNRYFTEGIDPSITLRENTNLFDFLIGTKRQRGQLYKIGGVDIHDKVIRYYVSKNGSPLRKYYLEKEKTSDVQCHSLFGDEFKTYQSQDMVKGRKVVLMQECDGSMKDDIDYSYYVTEAQKLILEVEGQ